MRQNVTFGTHSIAQYSIKNLLLYSSPYGGTEDTDETSAVRGFIILLIFSGETAWINILCNFAIGHLFS